MIAIETERGELVRLINNVLEGEFGFHRQFGFMSKERALKREAARKRQGHDFTKSGWDFSFHMKKKDGHIVLADFHDCEAIQEGSQWHLKTPKGLFKIVEGGADYLEGLLIDQEDKGSWLSRTLELTFLITFLLIPMIYLFQGEKLEEETKEEVEPITVTIVKPVETVNIQREANPDIKVKPLTQAEVSKRAVKRNLGFLGMLGSKELKDVVGGVPQKLEKATAGAGQGGDAGSGGEVLTGLGKGLKKTTVGNTGVQGLGGIGTKGAGGGKGGYGNTLVASGNGQGISAIAVSSSDVVLEGGISRYAINATIAKYLNQVRRCYEERLKINESLQGLVEMQFEINAQGRLNFANVRRTTLNDAPTEKCISEKMMTWQFPKPKGAVKVPVKYPFMLRPVGS